VRRWSEPVDLPLLLSQTKYNWSLAADEVDIDSATHDMVSQCGAGGLPKSDLRQYTYERVVVALREKMV
jgi:hypothetical protein